MNSDIPMSSLRSKLPDFCRWVFFKGDTVVVHHMSRPVIQLIHPDKTPVSKEVSRLGITEARDNLSALWSEVYSTSGHAVITFHGKPRAVMVPYVEPEAA